MMHLLAVTAVLLLGRSCYNAARIEDFGSETVRALIREGPRPRPASNVPHLFLNSRNDESEPEFDSTVLEPGPEMTFEDYLRAGAPTHKREPLNGAKENLETLDSLLRELQNDVAGCRDVHDDCEGFDVDGGSCWDPDLKQYMETNCRKTCGYCKCYDNFKFGCCTNDNKVPAEGPDKKGCSKKLCVDFKSYCQEKKARCNVSVGTERETLERECSYTCGYCSTTKVASPQIECERRTNPPPHGCCWDGSDRSEKGCRVCEDIDSYACKKFIKDCSGTPYYHRRQFINLCPKTCGRCNVCSDTRGTIYCERYKRQGFCRNPFIKTGCKKTCGSCG